MNLSSLGAAFVYRNDYFSLDQTLVNSYQKYGSMTTIEELLPNE